jgi:ribosomal protein L4
MSARNIERSSFLQPGNVSGYDLVAFRYLIMSESAFSALQEMVKS